MSEAKSEAGVSRRDLIVGTTTTLAAIAFTPKVIAAPYIITSANGGAVNLDHFVADCIEANRDSDSQGAVREVLKRAVSKPDAMLAALGEPHKAGIKVLHKSRNLTIFNAMWTPQMNLLPHNHLMWANIGIYTGREDNILWRREEDSIKAYSAQALFEGDVGFLPQDGVHSVTNPLLRFTGGIHIYGGDFFDTTRSEWDPETLEERPSDGPAIRAMFDAENIRRAKKAGL